MERNEKGMAGQDGISGSRGELSINWLNLAQNVREKNHDTFDTSMELESREFKIPVLCFVMECVSLRRAERLTLPH
jgi:hypothetical protein